MKTHQIARRELVPSGAIIITPKQGAAEVFLFEDEQGRPCARAFKGRRTKSDLFCYYSSPEQREKYVTRFLNSVQQDHEAKEKIKQRRSQPHTLKVGDILVSSWGYDQTNVDFYKVTELVGKSTVKLVRIGWIEAPNQGNETFAMQGKKLPRPEHIASIPTKHRVDMGSGEPCLTVGFRQFARPWDGKPMFYSTYA